jgi:hypothetical protein
MPNVDFVGTRFAGRLDFIVVRYSVNNVVKLSGMLETNAITLDKFLFYLKLKFLLIVYPFRDH